MAKSKSKQQIIVCCSIFDNEIDWLDSVRDTEYGRLTRSAVLRNLIVNAMKTGAQRDA